MTIQYKDLSQRDLLDTMEAITAVLRDRLIDSEREVTKCASSTVEGVGTVKITDLKVGDKVRFIGPKSEHGSENITVGKVYEIIEADDDFFEGYYLVFIGDNGSHSIRPIINRDVQHLFERVVEETITHIKSPNQQRHETIQRTREFVEGLREGRGRSSYYIFGDDGHWCTPQFIVNPEKRTVITLLRWDGEGTNKIMSRGIAKCNPSDVFNADIGKAIALARALGIDIPREFLQAVQPINYAVGQVVTFPKDSPLHMKNNYRVDTVRSKESELTKLFDDGSKSCGGDLTGSQFDEPGHENVLPIIDDTNAEYEVIPNG